MPDSCPTWDLTDLYADIGDASIKADIEACRSSANGLAADWQGKRETAEGAELAAVITEYQRITEILGKAASHAQLEFAANTTAPDIARHHQSIREAGAEIGAALLFIELELARLPQDRMDVLLEVPALAHWAPWLRRVRAGAPHMLAPDMERMLAERAPSGRGAWVRLFDETAASLRFPFRGTEVTEAEILNSLSSADADERREAGASLSSVMGANQRLLSLVLNTIAKDKEVEDRWRGFARPVASRNLDNDVEDETVDALVSAVDSRNADLAAIHAILSDLHVVADHDQIIQFCTAANSGRTNRSPIDRRAGADLGVITQDHCPQRIDPNDFGVHRVYPPFCLCGLDTSRFRRHEAKSVSANTGVCVNDDAVTQFNALADSNARMKQTILS